MRQVLAFAMCAVLITVAGCGAPAKTPPAKPAEAKVAQPAPAAPAPAPATPPASAAPAAKPMPPAPPGAKPMPPQVSGSKSDKPVAPTPATPNLAKPEGAMPAAQATGQPLQTAAQPGAPAPQDPEKAPADPAAFEKELLAEWRAFPLKTRQDMAAASDRAAHITLELWKFGPNGIAPLLDMLGEKDGHPLNKALVAQACGGRVAAKDAAKLVELTKEGQETTGRACAAMLLAFTRAPEALERARALMEDPERRVRMSAAMELIRFEDKGALAKVKAILADPELTPAEEMELLNVLPDSSWAENLSFFEKVAQNQQLGENSRIRGVDTLGQLGKKEQLPVLESVTANDPHALVKVRAMAAQDAIRAREGMEPLKPKDVKGAPPAPKAADQKPVEAKPAEAKPAEAAQK